MLDEIGNFLKENYDEDVAASEFREGELYVVASSRHRPDYKDNIFYQAKVNKIFEEEVEALFID